MLKITPRNSLKDHKKIKQFSSIIKNRLDSEFKNTKKINTFTFEELSDLNKILAISDFILAKYEHKKNVHSILNEFVDLIKETENSIISMDDEIEELTLSARGPINHIMEIKNKIESVSLKLFFASNVKPTTTGKIVISRKKSYLSRGPNVASPMKNFEESI